MSSEHILHFPGVSVVASPETACAKSGPNRSVYLEASASFGTPCSAS
jgi:hypothetical protein